MTTPEPPALPAALELQILPSYGAAMAACGARLIRRLVVRNPSHDAWTLVEVHLSATDDALSRHTERVDGLAPLGQVVLEALPVAPSTELLHGLEERRTIVLRARLVADGELVHELAVELDLLPATLWPGTGVLPELLAAWVRPNSRSLPPVLKAAAKRLAELTGDSALCGYQRKDPRHAWQMARAVWEAVAGADVSYITVPASFEAVGQRIRSHEEVLGDGLGNCLDLSALLAALLEQCGLHPLIVIVEGHAFVGCWLTEFSLHEPSLDDPLPLRKRVELGEALVVDSSSVAQGASFDEAIATAERHLQDVDRFHLVVDVHAARKWGVLPDGSATAAPGPRAPGDVHATGSQGTLPGRWREDELSPAAARTRIDRWASKLLDLTLRNRLLNFREGKKTVGFVGTRLGATEDRLVAGGLELRGRPDLRSMAGEDGATPRELLTQLADRSLDEGVLIADLLDEELGKRLLELFRSSRSALQDSGAVTLYLAAGMLRWYETPSSETARLAPLVLIPVSLERATGSRPWRLVAVDDDTRINVTLLEKLRGDYGLDVAGLETVPTDEHGVDLALILRRFRQLVRDQDRWEVRDTMWLGQFSFTKLLMWLDLQAKRDALLTNPVVQHMFEGGGSAFALAQPLTEESDLDAQCAPRQTSTLLDADPTQLQAILAAVDGSSFVLQGPPGTGKSQTITNLIGRLLDEGKTVLFVSEKMAALHVVRDRLVKVGLGPFCLELHSPQASKRAVMEQIKGTFTWKQAAAPPGWERHLDDLRKTRDSLNAHAERLATPSPFGSSARDVLGHLFALHDHAPLPLPAIAPLQLTEDDVRARQTAAHAAAVALGDVGQMPGHPWRGVEQPAWTPAWEADVVRAAKELGGAVDDLAAAADELRGALGLANLGDLPADLALLDEAVDLLRGTPELPSALLAPSGFTARLRTARGWLDEAAAVRQRRDALQQTWTPALLDAELQPLQGRYHAWAHAFFLFAWIMLWSARQQLAQLAHGALPAAPVVRDQLDEAAAVQAALRALAAHDTDARAWLGAVWRGADTDPAAAQALLAHAERVHHLAFRLMDHAEDPQAGSRLRELASDGHALLDPSTRTGARLDAYRDARDARARAQAHVVDLARLNTHEAWGPQPTLEAQRAWTARAVDAPKRLRPWCAAVGAMTRLRALGLAPVLDALWDGSVDPTDVEAVVDRSLHQAWWDAWLAADPARAAFRGAHHADLVQRFRQLDGASLGVTRQLTVATLAARMPDERAPGDQMALLRRQLQLKRRHKPLRVLFQEAGDVLRALKPCVLMSPLSVAKYLDPQAERFDVVVFDEASQIPSWDAVGAIARGKQLVVVGDSRQLPPTSFFASGDDDDSEADDEDLEELESILDEAVASGLPELRLRWHYRSRHESLIAFSNHHYYDNALHTFPSADDKATGRGVELRPVPTGFYDRGRSRTNRAEAEAVVAELLALLALPDGERPSVGVVTFSVPQQRLVEDLLDAALLASPELQAFTTDAAEEPVFVKNLESVQGDERDVMLFTIGYGPDRAGKVTMNFGPLNREGGERRLNVAVTRARERLVVFSTLRHDQIDLARTRAVGVHHLERFLRYAEQGVVALDAALTVRDHLVFESPFEEAVHAFLTRAGHEVHTQIGSSGYRIDLGIVDPERPGAYLMAVECDGATYHGSRNARERDRLRDAVLEGLGWRIYRVWSTDWWYERERAEQRLLAAVEAARLAPRTVKAPPVPTPAPPPAPPAPDADAPSDDSPWPANASAWVPPSPPAGGAKEAFFEATPALRAQLSALVAAHAPLHREEAYRTLAGAWGYARLGKRIAARLDEVARSCQLVQEADALWPPGADPAAYAGFRYVDEHPRELTTIPPHELANAAVFTVSRAIAIDRTDLQRETARVFGTTQLGARVASTVDVGVARAIDDGRLVEDAGTIRPRREA